MAGFAAIGLYGAKRDANVGGALRAAHCFGARLVVVEGARYRRAATDTTAAFRTIPLVHAPLIDAIPFDCVPVAVEISDGAVSLPEFVHPARAFYIFGPEDGSVPAHVIERCKHVVAVPTAYCLNLAATVNVLLYDRAAKARLAVRAAA